MIQKLTRILGFSGVFCVLLILLASLAQASLSISPAFVELSLDKQRPTGQFTISNTGNKPVRYRIQSGHFAFGVNGNFKMIPPDENSLANWIKFNPKELSLPPKSRQQVRFVVIPKRKLQDKLYWGAMQLESLEPNIARGDDQHGRSMSLAVIPAIVVPIFASHGKLDYNFDIQELNVDVNDQGLEFKALVENTGTGQLMLEGIYKLENYEGKTIKKGKFMHSYVMPRSHIKKTVNITTNLPEGEYSLKVQCITDNMRKNEIANIKIQ